MFVTVIVYLIISPSFTGSEISISSPSLSIATTSLSTVIPVVSVVSGSVSVPPTFAMFVITPFIDITSTANSLVTVSPAGTVTDHITESCVSETIAPSCAETNFVPSGTVSVMYVVPSTSPVFSTVIVYVIKSPILAISTISSFLVITLDLLVFIIAVSVGSPSLLSSPFAIAVFDIVPVTSSFTFTVNLVITVSPAGIDTTHFTPTTASVPTVVFVPTTSLDNSPSIFLNIKASSIDTKVVFCGILSVTSIFSTSVSLLFVTAIT